MGLNYKFSKKPPSDEVIVSYDPSIINKGKKISKKEALALEKEYKKEKKELIGHNAQSKLGLESALGKDERLFKLKVGFENGKYVTVASVCNDFKLSRATIIKYAKELGISLLDEEKGKWL